MAAKEYPVVRANLAPIRRRQVSTVRDLVPSLTGDKKASATLPLAAGQAPIAQQGRTPNYDAGSIMGLISSLRSEGEANPAFDPNKPVGGENVPYKGTSGAGGLFSRIFGNRANELNIEAQQTQAAEMRDKALREEERLAGIETYRTQKGIDKEIEDARDDKRNQQAIAMFDKAHTAQKELLNLQQAFTKAQSNDERAAILQRIQSQHANALDLQNRALAATEKNQGLQQAFQTRMANFNAQLDDYANKNKITSLGGGFFSRGGELYSATPGTPGYKNMPGTEPKISEPLFGPSGQGAQLPQLDGGMVAPRFQPPSVSFQQPATNNAPTTTTPSAAKPAPKDVPAQPTVTPTRADIALPQSPTASTEEGEEIQGLFPAIGEYLRSGEGLDLSQDAPGTESSRTGFGRALSDTGRKISEGARSIKPLLMGGRLPRYSEETGGGALGMLLNAPGALFSPVEAAGNYVLQNPARAMTGVDPRAGTAVLGKAQDPNTVYMSNEAYKNYLRRQRLNQ
jgi:hypothetical protein